MRTYITFLLNLTRTQKKLIALAADVAILSLAFWLSFVIRLGNFSAFEKLDYWWVYLGLIPASLVVFVRFGLYRAVVRYMNTQVVLTVGLGCVLSALSIVVLSYTLRAGVPRSVPFIYLCFCILSIGGIRVFMRSIVTNKRWHKKEPVLIYGAGAAGVQVQNVLAVGDEYYAAGFIDDRGTRRDEILQGVKVYSPKEIASVIKQHDIKKILLAMPEASLNRRKQLLGEIEQHAVKVLTIPNFEDVVSGKAKLQEFKDIGIEELLGREPVVPNERLMKGNIANKVVMVTGAGGSIGSELCRQIVKLSPAKLVLFELSEFALYQIEKELLAVKEEHSLSFNIVPILGSVQHQNRLDRVMKTFAVQTVYHAAAYKHVPLVEYNDVEGVRNNVFGTYYAARAAINNKVETFVLISTDKAVRPTNVMGVSKRLSEMVLQALNETTNITRFCMVRFGNVLGSSGSVVPLFKEQIKAGGPVTLTHPEITRYFMTIPEAAQLVIQAGAMGDGGDVFVLDMGEPVKIRELAAQMIRLSGFHVKDSENPDGDIEIKCTGLRPGEKLYEELLIGDNVYKTDHPLIMKARELMVDWETLEPIITKLDTACCEFDHELIRSILLSVPAGFEPTDGICDLVWHYSLLKTEDNPRLIPVTE